eukprot:6457253-Pyramimonas_sp.AAC.1
MSFASLSGEGSAGLLVVSSSVLSGHATRARRPRWAALGLGLGSVRVRTEAHHSRSASSVGGLPWSRFFSASSTSA